MLTLEDSFIPVTVETDALCLELLLIIMYSFSTDIPIIFSIPSIQFICCIPFLLSPQPGSHNLLSSQVLQICKFCLAYLVVCSRSPRYTWFYFKINNSKQMLKYADLAWVGRRELWTNKGGERMSQSWEKGKSLGEKLIIAPPWFCCS